MIWVERIFKKFQYLIFFNEIHTWALCKYFNPYYPYSRYYKNYWWWHRLETINWSIWDMMMWCRNLNGTNAILIGRALSDHQSRWKIPVFRWFSIVPHTEAYRAEILVEFLALSTSERVPTVSTSPGGFKVNIGIKAPKLEITAQGFSQKVIVVLRSFQFDIHITHNNLVLFWYYPFESSLTYCKPLISA